MGRIGKKVALSNHLVSNVNEYWDVKWFLNRHTRWGKLRWKIGGYRYLSELLANPVFIAALPNLVYGPSRTTLSFTALVGLIKVLGDFLIGRAIHAQPLEGSVLRPSPLYYFLAPLKDILIGILWFVPLISSTVAWRGNRYVIGRDSRLSPCPETGLSSWGWRITDSIRARVA
jgi:ceramide glucosyltransferase